MRKISLALICSALLSTSLFAAPCAFNTCKNCVLQRDILNDVDSNGLKYYASTNYDHRKSGEINVYDATLTQPYSDAVNAPGQVKFIANKINSGFWRSGELMTRWDLQLPPYNSPTRSSPWTTKEIRHGYLEVVVKMPKCDTSSDGVCQAGTQTDVYQSGLWPAIWLLPFEDELWPQNGEIDISEAYLHGTDYKTSTGSIHFNGNDARCGGNDCKFQGFPLTRSIASSQLWKAFHTWGFEWEPDPASSNGGQILNGYFDNVKVWGPLSTDTLPADGPGAMQRGFNDPRGGYYLIVNLALGGGYAGAPFAQMTQASMYVQSAKAYIVGDDVPPPVDTGTIKLFVGATPSQCVNANDKLFIDQDAVGQTFTVTAAGGTSKLVTVGTHQVRLASQTSIPAGNNMPGTCTSTLDQSSVQVTKDGMVQVTASYLYREPPPPTGKFSFNFTLGYPFLKVYINGNIPCPGADGKTTCLVTDQAVGSTMTVKGQGTNFCNIIVQSNGGIVIGAGSSRCFAVLASPATTTKPGKINLPGGFLT